MEALWLAILGFVVSHLIPALPFLRRRLVAAWGMKGYIAVYSFLSTLVFLWVAWAYKQAPYVEIWPKAAWHNGIALAAMLGAVFLGVGAFSSANPLSVGIGGKGFDATRPGILRLTRHPLIWAMILWAGGHIPANGDVASLLLFTPMLLLSLGGLFLVDFKRKQSLGLARWDDAARLTSAGRLVWAEIGLKRLVITLVVYLGLLLAHPWVIGVDPLGMF